MWLEAEKWTLWNRRDGERKNALDRKPQTFPFAISKVVHDPRPFRGHQFTFPLIQQRHQLRHDVWMLPSNIDLLANVFIDIKQVNAASSFCYARVSIVEIARRD